MRKLSSPYRQPEADIVHTWERHVWRTNHERHEPVAETTDDGWHDHEEHHDQAVGGDQDVPHVIGFVQRRFLASHHGCPALKILDTRRSKFKAHKARHRAAYDPCANRKNQIERTDIFVVGRHKPACEEAWLMIRVMMVMRVEVFTCCGNRGHQSGLFTWLALRQVQRLCQWLVQQLQGQLRLVLLEQAFQRRASCHLAL